MVHLEEAERETLIIQKIQSEIMKQYRVKKEHFLDNISYHFYQHINHSHKFLNLQENDIPISIPTAHLYKTDDHISLESVPSFSDFLQEYTGNFVDTELGKCVETYADVYKLITCEYIESQLLIPALSIYSHNYEKDFKYFLEINNIEYVPDAIVMKGSISSDEYIWFELADVYVDILDEIQDYSTKELYYRGQKRKDYLQNR